MQKTQKEGAKGDVSHSLLGKHTPVWTYGMVLAAFATIGATSCGTAEQDDRVQQVHEGLSTPVTVSFRNGALPTSGYAGTEDGTIRQAAPTTSYGSATTCEADGDDGGGVDKSCLIQWDVSAIPAGSTVQSASLTVRITDSSSNTYNLYALARSWVESELTWQNASNASPWETAGAQGASDRGPVVGSITGSGTKTVQLNTAGIAMVQSWVDGGTNAGFIIASPTNTNGLDIASSERSNVSQRPQLNVTYLPPATSSNGSGGATSDTTSATSDTTSTTNTTNDTTSTTGTGGGGSISTDPFLKVGFIGDTSTGTNFRNVLTLIKNEGAAAVVVEGDMSYSANPTAWWNDVDTVLGTTFPVFISRGNHDDSSWSGYLPRADQHLGGATREPGAHDANYKTTFRGLVIATIKKGDSGARISPFFEGDSHIWKICQWHQNQQAMQVGSKTDEMGWDVYETCRQYGAIIETGHEHSYSRTKTLTSMSSQIVDSTCTSASSLCLGPGRTFANVVGLGGNSVRDQQRCLPTTPPYGCNGEWAFIYTSNQSATFGAQFIVFNAGDPNLATGYFKNVTGQTVDSFTITHD